MSDEDKLAKMLAGEVQEDLTKSTVQAPVARHLPESTQEPFRIRAPQAPTQQSQFKDPNIIEQPKSTPSGEVVIGKEVPHPDLIPIPDDLKKFVQNEIPDGGDPTQLPRPQDQYPPLEVISLEELTGASDQPIKPLSSAPEKTFEALYDRLVELDEFVRERDKAWSKTKVKKKKNANKKGTKTFTGPDQTEGTASRAENTTT